MALHMTIWKFLGMVVEVFEYDNLEVYRNGGREVFNVQRLIPLQIEHIYAFIVELTGNPCPIVELLRFCG